MVGRGSFVPGRGSWQRRSALIPAGPDPSECFRDPAPGSSAFIDGRGPPVAAVSNRVTLRSRVGSVGLDGIVQEEDENRCPPTSSNLKRIKLKTAEIMERISAVRVEYRQKAAFLSDNHLRVVLHSYFMGGKKNQTQKAEIEAILSAVIPDSPDISNRTMNEINQLIEAQKRDVEQKLALISANSLNVLLKEREAHEARIADIDAKLRSLCREIGVDLGAGGGGAAGSGVESPLQDRPASPAPAMSEKLITELKKSPRGMSQKDLSKATGCSYSAVMKWVKENPDQVKTTGEKRGKKVFLV